MGTVRKTITLTDKQDGWIKAQIDAGHYTNDSEYIRDLIRREQERSAGRRELAGEFMAEAAGSPSQQNARVLQLHGVSFAVGRARKTSP